MSITDELRKYVADNRAIYMTPFAAKCLIGIADSIDAEHQKAIRELNNLADASVLLPVDADGVTWNVGDRDEDDNTVIELKLTSSGWCVITDGGLFYRPDIHRHHHAPTVEDVLREFYSRYCITKPKKEDDAIIAEYAAKLRLAGDDE